MYINIYTFVFILEKHKRTFIFSHNTVDFSLHLTYNFSTFLVCTPIRPMRTFNLSGCIYLILKMLKNRKKLTTSFKIHFSGKIWQQSIFLKGSVVLHCIIYSTHKQHYVAFMVNTDGAFRIPVRKMHLFVDTEIVKI